MFLAVALDVVVVAWLLWRQLKVRRVWPRLTLRLSAILCVIGLVELLSFAGSHHVSGEAVGVLTFSFVVGAVALGALRALTVKIWRAGPVVLRQGTWLTMALWAVSLALHFSAAAWIDSIHGQGGVVSASLLLWLGITYGVQNAVVHRRAEGLLEAAGPIDARARRWPACGSGPAGGRVRGAPAAGAGPGARGRAGDRRRTPGPSMPARRWSTTSRRAPAVPAIRSPGESSPLPAGAADPAPAHGGPVPPGPAVWRPAGRPITMGRRGPTTARERRMSHDEHQLLIGGEWVDASGGTYEVVNPATEEVVGRAPDATADDARAAAAAAPPGTAGVGGHPGGRPLRPAGPGGRGHPLARPRSSCRW